MNVFFFSSRRRHTRWTGDWSSDVCSSDLAAEAEVAERIPTHNCHDLCPPKKLRRLRVFRIDDFCIFHIRTTGTRGTAGTFGTTVLGIERLRDGVRRVLQILGRLLDRLEVFALRERPDLGNRRLHAAQIADRELL